jgi:hypothetical protein
VLLGHVVDQLHDQHGLAHTGAAEQADLAALAVRGQQVDDLDPGLEHLDLGVLLDEGGRLAVDRQLHLRDHRALLVGGLADHVEDPAQALLANRHLDRRAGVERIHPAHQAVGGVHRHRAHGALAQVLRDLERQVPLLVADARIADQKGREDRGQVSRVEHHVDHGADDLGHLAHRLLCFLLLLL